MNQIKPFESRDKIPPQYKWNTDRIYETLDQWENDFQKVTKSLPELKQFQGTLSKSPQQVAIFLRMSNETEMIAEKLYVYAHLKKDEDTRVQKWQELYQKAHSIYVQLSEATSFFSPEMMALTDEQIQQLYQAPQLEEYKHFFENLFRQRKHVLDPEQENMMAMAGEVFSAPGQVFSMLDNADLKFGNIIDETGREIELTKALYGKFQQSPDRRLRKESYITLYKPYIEHRNMLAANYSAQLNTHVFQSRVRKYENTLHRALNRNNIPVQVFENLLTTTHQYFEPMHRYVALRKQILNLKDVHDYDLLAPLASSIEKEYSYEEAIELVLNALKPLGDEYLSHLTNGLKKGWVDVFESRGKRSGAYSSGAYLTEPYVLLNYTGTLNDVFTIAHELGHSMHSFYTRKNNPYIYGDYSIFLAEIASTLNESLLSAYLIQNAPTGEEKIMLLNEQLDKFARTFYRQVLFAEFEWETHKMAENHKPLTADSLDELFGKLYGDYHGSLLTVDRETKAMWSRIPHFYYNYYVFQYATGIAASTALAADILQDSSRAVPKYLDFLKAGSRDYPLNVLKKAGVNMETPEPVIKMLTYMQHLLDELRVISTRN